MLLGCDDLRWYACDTHTHIRTELDHCSDPSGTESHNVQLNKIIDFADTSKGRLPLISLWHMAVFVGTGTRVTPVPPAFTDKIIGVLHLFRCSTRTPCRSRVGRLRSGRVRWKWGWKGMKVRWKWRWNEKLLSRDRRRGTQKKREGANTNTNTPGPKQANPERAREEKRRQTDTETETEQDQRRRGGRKRLNQPTTPKPTPT